MSQTPVLFPGAALSRNSVMRNSALQAGAYVAMDASVARLPVTCDEALVTDGANPLTANKARFARLKMRDDAAFTVASITAWHGYPMSIGSSSDVGVAIYEYRKQPYGFSLSLIAGYFENMQYPGSPSIEFNLNTPMLLDRTKTYVIAVVASNPSALNAGCIKHILPSTSIALIAGYFESVDDITVATGWPKSLECNLQGASWGGGILPGQLSNVFCVASNIKSTDSSAMLYGWIY